MNITGMEGTIAEVNSSHQIETKAVEVSPMRAATERGDAFSWTSVTGNLAANATGLLVANLSKTRLLVIQSLYVYSDVPTLLKVHVPVAATWAGGTEVVGVNLNRELASVLPDAVAYRDEGGSTFAAANTVLTIATNEFATDQFGVMIENLHDGAIILGYDDAIGVDVVADGAAYEMTISGYFRDKS